MSLGVYVLRRKDDSVKLPYMIFILMASTFCLQIDLMSDKKDHHIDFVKPGQIQISMNTILGSGDKEVRINYEDKATLNWASNEKTNILLDSISFNISRADFINSAQVTLNQRK